MVGALLWRGVAWRGAGARVGRGTKPPVRIRASFVVLQLFFYFFYFYLRSFTNEVGDQRHGIPCRKPVMVVAVESVGF